MIHFTLSIINPFKTAPWRSLYQGEWRFSKNKQLEIQADYYAWFLLAIEVDLRVRGNDHAGPAFDIRLLGLGFRIAIRDARHWNYGANTWIENTT